MGDGPMPHGPKYVDCSPAPEVDLGDRDSSGKGVLLRCSECRDDVRLDVGYVYDKVGALGYLCLMTGGHYGELPAGLPYRKAGPQTSVGKSACCGAQLEGELYGYE